MRTQGGGGLSDMWALFGVRKKWELKPFCDRKKTTVLTLMLLTWQSEWIWNSKKCLTLDVEVPFQHYLWHHHIIPLRINSVLRIDKWYLFQLRIIAECNFNLMSFYFPHQHHKAELGLWVNIIKTFAIRGYRSMIAGNPNEIFPHDDIACKGLAALCHNGIYGCWILSAELIFKGMIWWCHK